MANKVINSALGAVGKVVGAGIANTVAKATGSSGSSGGKGGSGGGSTGGYSSSQIKDQMDKNSQAWHGADKAEQDRLHQENVKLQAALDKATGDVSYYDPGSGKWTTYDKGVGSGNWIGGNGPQYSEPAGGGGYQGGYQGGYGPQYPYQFGSVDEMKEALGYNQVSAAQKAAIDAYIQQTVNGLNAQKSGVTQSAEEQARQAYVSYMKSKTALPQALSAAGYSGGMADSQQIGLETNLQNNQREIGMNRDNALNEIESAIINARLEGDIKGAEAQAQLGREAATAYFNYINQANSYANQDYWQKYGYDFSAAQDLFGKQFQAGQGQLERAWQAGQSQLDRDWRSGESQLDRDSTTTQRVRDEAWNLIMSGILPGDDILTAAGIGRDSAQSYVAEVQRQLNSKLSTKKTGGGTVGGTTGGSYMSDMVNRFNSGDYSSDVINGLLAAGYTMEQMQAAGYSPSGSGPVTSYDQLGPGAKGIAAQMGHLNSTQYPEYFAEVIQKAVASGGITETEASYLLQMMGY